MGTNITKVSSRTSGYFEIKLLLFFFCGTFWLFLKAFRDRRMLNKFTAALGRKFFFQEKINFGQNKHVSKALSPFTVLGSRLG